mgnify:CR=1 FL=1
MAQPTLLSIAKADLVTASKNIDNPNKFIKHQGSTFHLTIVLILQFASTLQKNATQLHLYSLRHLYTFNNRASRIRTYKYSSQSAVPQFI